MKVSDGKKEVIAKKPLKNLYEMNSSLYFEHSEINIYASVKNDTNVFSGKSYLA